LTELENTLAEIVRIGLAKEMGAGKIALIKGRRALNFLQ